VACGLRAGCDGTEIFGKEGVEEGGFSHVGCSDEGEESGAVGVECGGGWWGCCEAVWVGWLGLGGCCVLVRVVWGGGVIVWGGGIETMVMMVVVVGWWDVVVPLEY